MSGTSQLAGGGQWLIPRTLRAVAIAVLGLAVAAAADAAPTAEALNAQAAAASSWPHTIEHDGASVTVYQPQAISWPVTTTRLPASASAAGGAVCSAALGAWLAGGCGVVWTV